jgi:hypothetical protein
MESNNKILVYDDACPMCVWYTGEFVECGLLTEEARKPFSTLSAETLSKINWQRSKNEIPLLDTNTGEVLYGIDAMLEVIGQRFSIIKKIGNCKPLNYFLKKLYKFISYNRKVIVAKKALPGTIDCTPDYNVFYRVLFMSIFLIFNTLMLFPIHAGLLLKVPGYSLSVWQLQWVHIGLVGCNIIMATLMGRHRAIDYLGQINMLALITILCLIPLLMLDIIVDPGNLVNIIYLSLLALAVVKEYSRRMHYVDLPEKFKWVRIINLASVVLFAAILFFI